QMAGIRKDDAAQVDGRQSGVNRATEALFHETRNPSAVIEVSVCQNDCVDFFGGHRSITPVALAPFFRPLEQSAIDENLEAGLASVVSRVDEMLGAGDGSCRAEKLDVGQGIPPMQTNKLPR